jgi:hypothetical protein
MWVHAAKQNWVAFDGVPMVFLSSNMCSKERTCACHLRVPNDRMFAYIVCPCRFHTSGVVFYKLWWLLPNQVCPCAGVTFHGYGWLNTTTKYFWAGLMPSKQQMSTRLHIVCTPGGLFIRGEKAPPAFVATILNFLNCQFANYCYCGEYAIVEHTHIHHL